MADRGRTADSSARFAALRNRDCRSYLIGGGIAMMADNIEHVITYWVLWQKFHSTSLVGFQVISHWVPFLLLSVYFGNLADRYDCRRVIQVGQALFMVVSVTWGVLFLTGGLQMWNACLLLVLHGVAGALWGPAEQLMLHDLVGARDLPSAVRMNTTVKGLGVLCGPMVGSLLLFTLGPIAGIFVNAALYLPLTVFLAITRFTGHGADGPSSRPRFGLRDTFRSLQLVRRNRALLSMVVIAGLGSLFIGSALQSAMPALASDLDVGTAGIAYGLLLFANGVGGVVGGFVLEATGGFQPRTRTAILGTLLLGVSTAAFALVTSYVAALILLVVSGVANMVAMSVAQTVVQLEAPVADRGRVIGVFSMSSGGLRAGSGVTIGVLGGIVGLRGSLALSATALCVGTLVLAVVLTRGHREPTEPV